MTAPGATFHRVCCALAAVLSLEIAAAAATVNLRGISDKPANENHGAGLQLSREQLAEYIGSGTLPKKALQQIGVKVAEEPHATQAEAEDREQRLKEYQRRLMHAKEKAEFMYDTVQLQEEKLSTRFRPVMQRLKRIMGDAKKEASKAEAAASLERLERVVEARDRSAEKPHTAEPCLKVGESGYDFSACTGDWQHQVKQPEAAADMSAV
eukprot:gnl/TRDRNA2_/TRDRNA2_179596_c0_seq1.p1 gnl/TRDRNA2_/TRDRNA2_179596_c0~~gnl/TRDRNA2_/TRDRNA2_179596_c0_seq1.p1  ORF type:complete len:218 (+),score=59.50 gnl/TRDRNA2_/TRDRNA2_179596_c0_seq1:25-654(+)